MTVKFPCSVCSRAVAKNHKAVKCDECDKWIHIKCNHINDEYKQTQAGTASTVQKIFALFQTYLMRIFNSQCKVRTF